MTTTREIRCIQWMYSFMIALQKKTYQNRIKFAFNKNYTSSSISKKAQQFKKNFYTVKQWLENLGPWNLV